MRLDRRPVLVSLLVALALSLGAVPYAVAQEEETAPSTDFGFLVGGGFPDEPLVGQGEDRRLNVLFGARLGHLFTERLGIFADAIFTPFDGSPSVGDTDEY